MKKWMLKEYDKRRFIKILSFQDRHKKDFFNMDGCGLEIEFGVEYESRCRVYIETGLRKIKAAISGLGKIVTDPSIGCFLNVEIVLKPFERDELKKIFEDIKSILDFYDNLVFNDNCGVHANFRANDELKKEIYRLLLDGRYDSERFRHGKYKKDFLQSVLNSDGTQKSYEEYIAFQENVGAKYCGINFLKPSIAEFRVLNMDWADVEFFYDLYDEAKANIS